MEETLIACEHLTKRFGLKAALDDVNLTIGRGRIVGLLGPNGSGKTTFLKMAAGLLRPSRGQILFQGHPLSWRDRALFLKEGRLICDVDPEDERERTGRSIVELYREIM